MSSNYQQKKMMNALGAIDTKGNTVPSVFQTKPQRQGTVQPLDMSSIWTRRNSTVLAKCLTPTFRPTFERNEVKL